MRGKIIVSSFFTKLFSAGKASAVTVFPFIFVRHKSMRSDIVLVNHESIHIAQVVELLVFPFYMMYFCEFLVRLIQYRNTHKAYLNISFEREAYAHEADLNYLKRRGLWQFIHYY